MPLRRPCGPYGQLPVCVVRSVELGAEAEFGEEATDEHP
jgi:hypothetical protein